MSAAGDGTSTRVAVVGPGRVGTALAHSLPADRYVVVGVAGRGEAAVERFCARVPAARPMAAGDAARAADLVLLTLPDDALATTVRELAGEGAVVEGSRWVHCSGGLGLATLRPAVLAGARAAACHPAQTFPDPDRGREHLAGAAWAVTAAPADDVWARELVADLGGVAHTVPEHSRVLYHAALAVGANGVSAVTCLARDLLLGAGVRDPEGFLEPLSTAAARGASTAGAAALTGPVRRGDAGTVAAHLDALGQALPEAEEAYRVLARLALGYARRAGLGAQEASAVEEALR